MNKEPLISIIIPTYNRAVLLQETLNSILNQTYHNFEIIIISDASPDNTNEVIKKFDDNRIIFHELADNLKYPGRVRNVGLRLAKGEFIAFCDDDDLWMKHKLETQINYLLAHDNIDMIATNSFLFPGHILPSMQLWKNKTLSYGCILSRNPIITPSVLLRKSVLNSIGLFDENELLHIGEDWDLWIRILQNKDKSIVILKECLTYNRLGNVKITDKYADVSKSIERDIYVYNKHKPFSNAFIQKLESNHNTVYNRDNQNTIKEMTRRVYTKSASFSEVFNSKNLRLSDKTMIFVKFYMKYLYKVLFQNNPYKRQYYI